MHAGDRAGKRLWWIWFPAFRLPYDNRPLNLMSFTANVNQVIFVCAMPGHFEKEKSNQYCGTGHSTDRASGSGNRVLGPVDGQIDDLISEINPRTAKKDNACW